MQATFGAMCKGDRRRIACGHCNVSPEKTRLAKAVGGAPITLPACWDVIFLPPWEKREERCRSGGGRCCRAAGTRVFGGGESTHRPAQKLHEGFAGNSVHPFKQDREWIEW